MTKRRADFIAVISLLVLALGMFADLLFAGGTRVVGYQITDLYLQFLPWRDFGFRELAKGNLALWNPYIFGGAPFFGAMQAALLYPPNWLFLFLPLAAAVNWTVAFHVFAIGTFMFWWMRVRRLHVVASFFAGVLVMFAGSHFLHIFAGHLPHLLAMTWAPLVFCSIDGLFERQNLRWSFVGMFAVAMQLLAGFPQHVFYTAIIAGLYSAFRLIGHWRWRLVGSLFAIYPGAAALSAVQLMPTVQTMRETIRGIPLPFEFASKLPFPPENLLTLLVPNFFGEAGAYWGRSYLWEACLFVGVTGFGLALYAAIYGEWKIKWIPIVIFLVALFVAFGAHTPLYRALYDFVPGFDKFRSVSKFIFTASLFLVVLAATGLDRLIRRKRCEVSFVIGLFALTALLACAAYWMITTNSMHSLMEKVYTPGESFLSAQLFALPDFTAFSQHRSVVSLVIAVSTCALFAGLLGMSKWGPSALYGIAALGAAEMFWFAHLARPTFDSTAAIDRDEQTFLAEHPGDYRVLNLFNPNSAMSIHVPELWGYDASVVRRYAEFVVWSQGGNPDQATQNVTFKWADPLFALLRLRYIFLPQAGNFRSLEVETPPLPRVLLISKYRIAKYRDAIFTALRAPDFDPRVEAILESEPDPPPVPTEVPGTAQIVAETTDDMTIETDVVQPAILLITDVYTPSWRAVSLPGSIQNHYRLQPANYVLRAVPLTAGHHRFRVEYFSPEFEIGKWISLVATVLFVGAVWKFRDVRL